MTPLARAIGAADSRDLETRARLVRAAAERFASRGFEQVTVREICAAAHANVAAVNYHFRDKAGLYDAVVDAAIQVMRETNDLAQRAAEDGTPDDQIRAFVRTFLGRLLGTGPNAWIHRLMAREVEQPTAAFDRVVRDVLEPRVAYLTKVAAAVMQLPPHDPRVARSVASLQGLCVYARHVRLPVAHGLTVPGNPETLAAHIAEFALAGMRAVAARPAPEAAARRSRAARDRTEMSRNS